VQAKQVRANTIAPFNLSLMNFLELVTPKMYFMFFDCGFHNRRKQICVCINLCLNLYNLFDIIYIRLLNYDDKPHHSTMNDKYEKLNNYLYRHKLL